VLVISAHSAFHVTYYGQLLLTTAVRLRLSAAASDPSNMSRFAASEHGSICRTSAGSWPVAHRRDKMPLPFDGCAAAVTCQVAAAHTSHLLRTTVSLDLSFLFARNNSFCAGLLFVGIDTNSDNFNKKNTNFVVNE